MPTASFLIFSSWIFWAAVLAGVGAWIRRPANTDDWFLNFWLGVAATVFFLQLWHFLFPVDLLACIAVAIIGFGGLALSRKRLSASVRALPSRWLPLLLILLLAAWLSQLALTGPRNGDSGLYYLPIMHWTQEHAIVPGLGNLHVRFASNQSFFLLASLLSAGPIPGIATHTANPLLILLLAAQAIVGCVRVLRTRGSSRRSDLCMALFVLPAAFLIFDVSFTSPTADTSVFVLGAVLLWTAYRMLERTPSHGHGADRDLLALAILAVAGITLKLSFLMLGFVMLAVAALLWWRHEKPSCSALLRTVAGMTLIALIGLLPWILRSVVLSGTLLYPASGTLLPVPWAMPAGILDAERAFIDPWRGNLNWRSIQELSWVLNAMRSFGWREWEVLLPFGIAAASVVATGAIRLLRGRSGFHHALLLLPAVAAVVWCFVIAPRPRFAGAAFWMLAIQCVVWAMDALGRKKVQLVPVCLAIAALAFVPAMQNAAVFSDLDDFQRVPAPRTREQTLASGLTVFVPQTDQCWNGPLLCTPTPHPLLRLRDAKDPGKGFTVQPAL